MSSQKILSRNDIVRICTLLFMTLFCVSFLIVLFDQQVPRQEQPKIFFERPKPLENLPIIEKNDNIWANVTDDRYLTLEAFFYCIHRMASMTEEEISSLPIEKYQWIEFNNDKVRNHLRGKFLKVHGNLATLQRRVMQGELAEKYGLENVEYWQGAINDDEGHLYLFAVTDFPEQTCIDDEVELTGMFYKVWIYTTQTGKEANNAYLIAKNFKKIPPKVLPALPIGKTIFCIFFILLCLFTIKIVYDRHRDKIAKQQYMQIKLNRLKKHHKNIAEKSERTESIKTETPEENAPGTEETPEKNIVSSETPEITAEEKNIVSIETPELNAIESIEEKHLV